MSAVASRQHDGDATASLRPAESSSQRVAPDQRDLCGLRVASVACPSGKTLGRSASARCMGTTSRTSAAEQTDADDPHTLPPSQKEARPPVHAIGRLRRGAFADGGRALLQQP